MSIYVHEFKVLMYVEVASKKDAERWIDTRLSGGDASFETVHTGKVRKMSAKEERAFNGEDEEDDG